MAVRLDLDRPGTYSPRFLRWFRRRALRRRVWFRELSGLERGIVDMSLRVVVRVRSFLLFRALHGIVSRVSWVLETWFSRRVREVGSAVAGRLVGVAVSLGYGEAARWRGDPEYGWFLGVKALHEPFGGARRG